MKTKNLRSTFKKRYLLLLLVFLYIGVQQSGCFSFRQSDEKQCDYLMERQQEMPVFPRYEMEGRNMQYTQVGGKEEDERPVVLFIHGSPGSSEAYLDYLADTSLSQEAVLLSVDRPGFGYSDFGKTERSLEKQSLLMEPILDSFATRKIILVGHSYGGPLAARMAMDFPDRIGGLVMVAPSIDPELEPPIWWRKIVDWWGIRWMIPSSLRVCNQEILPLKGELERMMPLWAKITAPATVIQGSKDKLVPKGNADFAQRMLTNSQTVTIDIVEGGNHFILWTEMPRVKNAIREMF
ncbi:MAG: alpha/beta hydrolase [Bacteroidota bacterium]